MVVLWRSWENLELSSNLVVCEATSSYPVALELFWVLGLLGHSSHERPLRLGVEGVVSWGCLTWSNCISLEGILSFSSSGETKAEPLFQSNMSLDPNFEVSITLCWFSLAAPTTKCLSVISTLTLKFFKRKHNSIHNPDFLCIFHLYMTRYDFYYFISPLKASV